MISKDYTVKFKSGEIYLFQIREDRFKLIATQDQFAITVHPNHQGLQMSEGEARHRMSRCKRLELEELINHPASDFSIDLAASFQQLCLGGSNWYTDLASAPEGRSEWKVGMRWHIICSIARPNDHVNYISREEAAMILFQAKE